ncbi:hypothetical protein BLNAU_3404 [Blattamonas nauphoetae]|uniref:Right handed beta helix domain-containing protein n=1 Tax=Blattamonas nauphoetae TaxID=2049346 RepID=A0ABQ9YCW2_9EUKA|nr:hypothetical protein BLNAU_3404 [Blattamonas nauphoetae]
MLIVVNTKVTWKQTSSLPLVAAIQHDDKYPVTELSENSILGRDADQARDLVVDIQPSILAASVSLTTSTITNVTSHRRFIGDDLRFPLASQGVISSSISECTNHLYGMGLLDLNFGSGVCCQNSSFSKCESDADPTEGPPTTCTLFDTCTFRDIHADRGGAIDSDETTTSPTIAKCSFLRCTADRLGGSVFYCPSPSCSMSVSHCSFVSGRAGLQGGGIQIANCKLSTIADCVFLNLSATTKHGGGLTLIDSPGLVTVSSCLFQKCRTDHATGSGGAVYSVKSGFVFASLRFRENNAATLNQGHDLWIELTTANQGVSSITECDTYQDPALVKIHNGTTITPDFIGSKKKDTRRSKWIRADLNARAEFSNNVQHDTTGFAFVTFRHSWAVDRVLSVYEESYSRNCLEIQNGQIKELSIGGNVIHVSCAPDPSDVLFENIGITQKAKAVRPFFLTLYSLIGIIIGIVIIIVIKRSTLQYSSDFFLTALIAIVNSIVKYIIRMIVSSGGRISGALSQSATHSGQSFRQFL